MDVSLRAQRREDLHLLTGEAAGFDDFGPSAIPESPQPPKLDEAGALSVITLEDEVAGMISWHWRHWGPNRASWCPMIGIWLRPGHRAKGVGRAAQRQLAELFFEQTTTNRVEAHTDVENIAEQRALEAAGFEREATIHAAQWRNGAYHDGYLYVMLRDRVSAVAAPVATPVP